MQFAHPGNNRLPGFLIGLDPERWVFSGQTVECQTHLLLVALGVRLDCDFDDRLGKLHTLEYDGMARITKRITCRRFLQTGDRHDIARIGNIDIFTRIGVHLQHPPDTLALVLHRVEQRRSLVQLPGIYPAESQRTDKRVVHDLERKK